MIVTSDVGNILYRDCEAFGIKVYQKGDIPDGEVTAERVIIIPKKQSPDTYWKKGFVEVNLCVPDVDIDTANLVRLGELERQAMKLLDDVVDSYDGSTYRYSIDSTGMEADTGLKCHYVNVRILFEVLNVK